MLGDSEVKGAGCWRNGGRAQRYRNGGEKGWRKGFLKELRNEGKLGTQ